MATTEQLFSLRWNNFHSNLTNGFHEFLEASDFVDVTLAVDGHFFQAHKIVLSICSPYFKQMFKVNPCNHPIVILKDVAHDNMKDILEFMYMGEVNVLRDNLSAFLRTAELLQVKGLTGDDSSETSSRKDDKSDSVVDQDEDTDLMQFSQFIDSDVELPAHYSTPNVTSNHLAASAPTSSASKRQTKSTTSNCKRVKAEPNTNSNKLVKSENDINAKTNLDELDLGSDQTTSAAYLNSSNNDLTAANEMDDARDNLRQTIDNNTSEQDLLSYSVDVKGHVYCPYCFRKFVNRYNLKVHIRDKHEDNPSNLDCHICGKVMRNRSCLRVHMYHHRKNKLNEVKGDTDTAPIGSS